MLLGWFVGLARADIALALQVAINLVNVVGTALLVLVLDLGVAGAALGARDGGGGRIAGRARARAAHRRDAACRDLRAPCSTARGWCGCS